MCAKIRMGLSVRYAGSARFRELSRTKLMGRPLFPSHRLDGRTAVTSLPLSNVYHSIFSLLSFHFLISYEVLAISFCRRCLSRFVCFVAVFWCIFRVEVQLDIFSYLSSIHPSSRDILSKISVFYDATPSSGSSSLLRQRPNHLQSLG